MAEQNYTPSPPPSLSDAINKIMENPELISMVANALGNSNNSSNEKKTNDPNGSTESISDEQNTVSSTDIAPVGVSANAQGSPDLGEMVSSLVPLLSGLSTSRQKTFDSKGGHDAKCRNDLLCALKPYVSPGRQEAINYIIRISQLSDMLKHLN